MDLLELFQPALRVRVGFTQKSYMKKQMQCFETPSVEDGSIVHINITTRCWKNKKETKIEEHLFFS